MKKSICILFLFLSLFTGFAESSKKENDAQLIKNVLMIDGKKADVLFSQNWSGVNSYANDKNQWKGKYSVLAKAKTESDLGYGNVWHNEFENDAIKALCTIMKKNGFKYGVTFVQYDKRVRRCMFTYKKGKVRNSFMDFFEPTHKFYVAYTKKQAEKEQKRDDFFDSLSASVKSSSSSNSKTNEQTLYTLRHKTYELISIGTHNTGGTKIFQYRYIYYDNGRRVEGYVVDLDGNIRHDYPSTDFSKSYPIVKQYSVPKEIRDLAMKSLE